MERNGRKERKEGIKGRVEGRNEGGEGSKAVGKEGRQ
jgi:hypothetical protein